MRNDTGQARRPSDDPLRGWAILPESLLELLGEPTAHGPAASPVGMPLAWPDPVAVPVPVPSPPVRAERPARAARPTRRRQRTSVRVSG